MKQESYKQAVQDDVGFETSGGETSKPTSTVGFDFSKIQEEELRSMGIDPLDLEKAGTPEKIRELLRTKLPEQEIDDLLSELAIKNSPPDSGEQAADTSNRWTLPEAMEFAKGQIAGYLPYAANDVGWATLAQFRLLGETKGRVTPEQIDRLKTLPPEQGFTELCPPEKRAEVFTAFIRSNPRCLLDQHSDLMRKALVDLC